MLSAAAVVARLTGGGRLRERDRSERHTDGVHPLELQGCRAGNPLRARCGASEPARVHCVYFMIRTIPSANQNVGYSQSPAHKHHQPINSLSTLCQHTHSFTPAVHVVAMWQTGSFTMDTATTASAPARPTTAASALATPHTRSTESRPAPLQWALMWRWHSRMWGWRRTVLGLST
jgi:hypothetical protein